MRVVLAVALATVLAGPAMSAVADAPPEKDRVGIDLLNVNGSGCKQGTAAVAVSPDNEAFTVTYSAYLVQAGAGAAKKDSAKDCRLNLKILPPAGYSYTILTADYRGYAELGQGAAATLLSSYYFSGPKPTPRSHSIAGPLSDNWQVTDTTDSSSLVFGPCGTAQNLSIDTELSVVAGPASGSSLVAMDSTDGSLQSTYHFGWARC